MADAIVSALLEAKVKQPLASLSLGYRSVSNYVPVLEPMTMADMEDAIQAYGEELDWEILFLPRAEGLIFVKKSEMEEQLKQLIDIMEGSQNFKIGRIMLRRAAFLLTRGKLDGKIAVSEDFVAYAIDWEGEGHDFEQILRECGQREEVIADWKKRGWIPPAG
jgi:hypothetical protein